MSSGDNVALLSSLEFTMDESSMSGTRVSVIEDDWEEGRKKSDITSIRRIVGCLKDMWRIENH